MKKILFLLLLSTTAMAQDKPKQDSTIQITLKLDEFRALLLVIDQNIDSKKLSKEVLEFLQKNTKLLQPADKPKQ